MDNGPDPHKPDGQYDGVFNGKEVEETYETVEADDGIEETRVNYTPKQANRWKFTTCHNQRNYEAIDWTK